MLELLAMISLALAWLVPNHYFPWTSVYSETCTGLGLLLLALSVGRRWNEAPVPNAVWVVVCVATIPGLQWASGRLAFSGDAWVSSLYVLGLAAAIATGHACARGGAAKASAMLAGAILVGSFISSLLAIMQGLLISNFGIYALDALPGMRPYANLGQPNNLATLIGMGSASLLLLRERRHVSAPTSGLILAILLLGVGLTQSRAAFLFGPIVFVGLVVAERRGIRFTTSKFTIAAATCCHWASTWYWPALQSALLLNATESLGQRGGHSTRFQVWPMLLDAVGQVPWTGYGWLQVGEAHLAVAEKYPVLGELWMHGHNLFLELIVWCGYPLGLLACSLIVYWLVSRTAKLATLEAVIALMVVLIFGWHAMLELPHHFAYLLIPVGLWIGQIEYGVGSRGIAPPRWNLAPVAISTVIALALWKDYPSIEEDFRLVRFENLGIGPAHSTELAPHAPFLSAQTEFLRFARTDSVGEMSETDLVRMEAVAKRYPYGRSLARLAWAWALNGRLDDAQKLFVKIRHIHGNAMYGQLRQDIRNRISEGQTGLIALEKSLPD